MKKALLLLLCLLAVLGSCAPAATTTDPAPAPQTQNDPQPGTQEAAGTLFLIKDDTAACEVVTATKVEWPAEQAASELRDAMNKKCKNGRIKLSIDAVEAKGMTEILVGQTKRELSKKLYEKLEWNQIGVLIADGKIAIGAGMDENLILACNWFRKTYTASVKAGAMTVPDSLEYFQTVDVALPEAPAYGSFAMPAPIGCGDGNYLLLYSNTNASDYLSYLDTLNNSGYTKVMDNAIGENRYATYTNGQTDVHCYYLENLRQTKVILSPAGNTVPREENAAVVAGKTNDLYTLNTINFGLSMVIRLKDGRFIIIDGAQQSESENLVNFLLSLSPEGQPAKIAAWIVTHAHPDHSFALMGTQSNGLYEKLDVEHFVFNFPSNTVYQHFEPDCIAQTQSVWDTVNFCYPDAKVVKPHTGNQMILGDVTVDFLSTQEDVLPYAMNDFNDSSLVMRFTVDGNRLMVTGDMSVGNFAFCNAVYEEEDLKSDFFQIPHHGHNVDSTFFDAVDPSVAFLPGNTEKDLEPVLKKEENQKLQENAAFYTSMESYKFTLPFAGENPGVLLKKGA